MTLPGFTAETSLYKTSGQYYPARTHRQIQGTVYPAQLDKFRWTVYGPTDLKCSPMTICQPLNYFCEICTEFDENCRPSTPYQSCIGVKIPNKIPINVPDPVVSLKR
jgi:hypothetical protein